MSDDNNTGDTPLTTSGIRSMMRPGTVRVVGHVGPRPVNRFVRPQFNATPRPATNFDGVVDDRVLPDAGLPTEYVQGYLDVAPDGHGYLRPKMAPSSKDIYISVSQVRRFNLRPGDLVGGQGRSPKDNERFWGLLKVEKVNDTPVEEV